MHESVVTFGAELKRVSTTLDGGWTITFTVDNSEAQRIMQLSQFRDQYLQVAVAPFPKVGDSCNAV